MMRIVFGIIILGAFVMSIGGVLGMLHDLLRWLRKEPDHEWDRKMIYATVASVIVLWLSIFTMTQIDMVEDLSQNNGSQQTENQPTQYKYIYGDDSEEYQRGYQAGRDHGREESYEEGYQDGITDAYNTIDEESILRPDQLYVEDWISLAEHYTGETFFVDGYGGAEEYIERFIYPAFLLGYYAKQTGEDCIYGFHDEDRAILDFYFGDYDVKQILEYAESQGALLD